MLIFQISGNWNPERQTQLHRIREKTGYIKLCLVTKLCPTLLRARQASLSLGFPRQEYWNGLPFLFPRDLPVSRGSS